MKKICALIICFAIIITFSFENKVVFAKEVIDEKYIQNVVDGIVNWKKQENGSTEDGFLMTDKFLEKSGTTMVDWYAFGLGRGNYTDNQSGYRAVVSNYVEEKYKSDEKLDGAKATEWHRIALSYLASGGNPRAVGSDKNGDQRGDIDLICDGVFNRVDENGKGILGRQGINGYIFGLITIDSLMYAQPSGSFYTRDDIILNILKNQLFDGGWNLRGPKSDPDMTGMALCALAPYYNSEKEYEWNDIIQGKEVKVVKKVRDAVDEAKEWLSKNQNSTGGFFSYGSENSESCVQAIVGLSSVGVNILTDKKFIKNGKTIFDKLLEFRLSNGGFTHSYKPDSDNPSSVPGGANIMAGGQALYGNIALLRFLKGERRLYDLRKEQSAQLKNQIKDVSSQIESLDGSESVDEIKGVYQNYLSIAPLERSYVFNYSKLSKLLAMCNISYEKEDIKYNEGDGEFEEIKGEFTPKDKELADNLPSTLTLEYKNDILRLNEKIKNCQDFEGKQSYKIKIEKAFNEIKAIEREIEEISRLIKDNLYPTESVNLAKRGIVYEILSRLNNLSEYDRNYIEKEDRECLLKSKKRVDSSYTAMIISVVCIVVVVILAVFVAFRIVNRKNKKKEKFMEESDE